MHKLLTYFLFYFNQPISLWLFDMRTGRSNILVNAKTYTNSCDSIGNLVCELKVNNIPKIMTDLEDDRKN